jgi:hypothetical protein
MRAPICSTRSRRPSRWKSAPRISAPELIAEVGRVENAALVQPFAVQRAHQHVVGAAGDDPAMQARQGQVVQDPAQRARSEDVAGLLVLGGRIAELELELAGDALGLLRIELGGAHASPGLDQRRASPRPTAPSPWTTTVRPRQSSSPSRWRRQAAIPAKTTGAGRLGQQAGPLLVRPRHEARLLGDPAQFLSVSADVRPGVEAAAEALDQAADRAVARGGIEFGAIEDHELRAAGLQTRERALVGHRTRESKAIAQRLVLVEVRPAP